MKKAILTLGATLMLCLGAFAQIGSIDPNFNLGTGFGPDQWTGKCETIVQQADGKLLVGGQFKTFNNNPALYLIRLNLDGSPDNSFSSPFDDSWGAEIRQVMVLSDGKILVCGAFLEANNVALPGILKLNSDGTIDQSFQAPSSITEISTFDVQSDGKIVLGNLSRLNADGSLDNSFNTGTGISGGSGFGGVRINAIKVQADGKILIAGHYGSYNGNTSTLLTRLNSDGTIDNSFTANANFAPAMDGFYGQVYAMKLLSNGKILIGGNYGNTNSAAFGVDRLNSDGSLDTTFKVTHSFSNIRNYALDVQSDGKLLVANVNFGAPSEAFVVERYHTDGSLDTSFPKKYVNNDVRDLIIQADGNITFVGYFNYNPTGIMRLIGDSPSSINLMENFSSNLEVYPNPALDFVRLSNLPIGSAVIVSDISGKTVYRSQLNYDQLTINTADFPFGVYFIKVEFNGMATTRKLIVKK